MPVISFATSKGGAGKTTSCIVLGTTLAGGTSVAMIDADPAGRLESWSQKASLPDRLSVFRSQGERHIQAEIDRARQTASFVLIDLEGAATRTNAYAMAESDLVVIPMGDEQQDADAALETLAQLAQEGRALRREIPAAILFARTKAAVKSRLAKDINAQMRGHVSAFEVELNDRTAFSSLHNLGGTLDDMSPAEIGGLDKARENASAFAAEVIDILEEMANVETA